MMDQLEFFFVESELKRPPVINITHKTWSTSTITYPSESDIAYTNQPVMYIDINGNRVDPPVSSVYGVVLRVTNQYLRYTGAAPVDIIQEYLGENTDLSLMEVLTFDCRTINAIDIRITSGYHHPRLYETAEGMEFILVTIRSG